MPVDSVQYIVNNPVSGTRYNAPMGYGVVPANGANPICHVQAYSGTNGTGSLVQVTTLQAWVRDETTATDIAHFSGNFNSVTAQGSGGFNGADWCKPCGEWSGGQSVGSLVMWLHYTGTPFTPSITSFTPTVGASGTSVTVSGSHFTDLPLVQFNGVSASFSITNDTTLVATVPAGATTGPISVGNASGSATSSSNFQPGQIWFGTGSGVAVIAAVWYGDPSGNGVPHKAAGVWVNNGSGGVKRVW